MFHDIKKKFHGLILLLTKLKKSRPYKAFFLNIYLSTLWHTVVLSTIGEDIKILKTVNYRPATEAFFGHSAPNIWNDILLGLTLTESQPECWKQLESHLFASTAFRP